MYGTYINKSEGNDKVFLYKAMAEMEDAEDNIIFGWKHLVGSNPTSLLVG